MVAASGADGGITGMPFYHVAGFSGTTTLRIMNKAEQVYFVDVDVRTFEADFKRLGKMNFFNKK